MSTRFDFADAFWFRIPLRSLVIGVSVFGLLSLYPALGNGTSSDHQRAIFGLAVLAAFVVSGTVFSVAINDSFVEIDDSMLRIRFEAFFGADVPLAWVVGVEMIEPHPRWRYRFGLATNFVDRISCSHGGALVAITLSQPVMTRLWPRYLPVTSYWVAVRDHETFIAQLRRIVAINHPTAATQSELARAA